MAVQIVTDSASDLTPALAERYGITVVPLHVTIEGETYRDGLDLTPAEYYHRMRSARRLPTTSQPTPRELEMAYRSALTRGPVLAVHVSSALSGTVANATMVAREMGEQVTVYDSLSGSGGLALLAVAAAEMAAGGEPPAAILNRLAAMREESQTLVLLETLENAVKGGRVSPLTGMAAGLLGVKPVVHVSPEGKVVPIAKVRGRAKAVERLLAMAAEGSRNWAERRVVVAFAGSETEQEAAELAGRVRERFGPKEILMLPIGAAIGTYTSEGALLFSF